MSNVAYDTRRGTREHEHADLDIRSSTSEEELALDRLVIDMAGRLARIDRTCIDDTIVDSLHRIVDALGIDRAVVWRCLRGEMNFILTHCWVPRPSPPSELCAGDFPWVFATLDAD